MKKSKLIIILFLMFSLAIFSSSCTTKKEDELTDPNKINNKLLETVAEQKHYSFQGKSSMALDEENLEDVIEFTGFVKNKENLYIKLSIVGLQGMPQESMEMVKTPEKIMIKDSEEGEWEKIEGEGLTYITEFTNLNPEEILKDIKDDAIETTIVNDEGEKKGIIVKIDPEVTAKKFKDQMTGSLGDMGSFTEEQIAQMKESGLSDEEIASIQEDMKGQLDEMNAMINTIQADATYHVYYDQSTYLINELTETVKTTYTMQGEEMGEKVVTNYIFSDYGKEKSLPTS